MLEALELMVLRGGVPKNSEGKVGEKRGGFVSEAQLAIGLRSGRRMASVRKAYHGTEIRKRDPHRLSSLRGFGFG